MEAKRYQCCHCGGTGVDSYCETCGHCEGLLTRRDAPRSFLATARSHRLFAFFHVAAQAADKLAAGDSWRGEANGHVFTTAWGDPIYPDTVTALPREPIKAHNQQKDGSRRPTRSRTRGCTT